MSIVTKDTFWLVTAKRKNGKYGDTGQTWEFADRGEASQWISDLDKDIHSSIEMIRWHGVLEYIWPN